MKWILLIFILSVSNAVCQEISIISSYPNLTKHEAISILGARDFSTANGVKPKIVLLPRDSYSTRKLSQYLGFTSTRFYEKTFYAAESGKLSGYMIVESEIDAIKYVSKNPGSIGYVQDYMIFNNATIPTIINIK